MTRLISVIAATLVALLLSFSAYASTPDSAATHGSAAGSDLAAGQARAQPGTVGGQGGPGSLPNTSTSTDLGSFLGLGLIAVAGAFFVIQRRRSP